MQVVMTYQVSKIFVKQLQRSKETKNTGLTDRPKFVMPSAT